jgi:two-component system, NtrC family, sensor kinase
MVTNLLLIILSVRFIRKNIKTNEILPNWDSLLAKLPYVAGFLFLGGNAIGGKFAPTVNLFWFVSLSFLLYILWLLKDNRLANTLLWAITPIVILNTVKDFVHYWTPTFERRYDSYFDLVGLIGFIWMFIFVIAAAKQQKVLVKEQEKLKAVQAQKDDLETLVSERTAEITQQKEELEKTLEELKATQDQLIQREKMASLGELTAGIAHEIQNPLNFVNNFAELSGELAEELKDEINKPDFDRTLIIELVNDLTSNQEKINHHGKRASNIVKGMLEHSRTSTGKKEATDINALIEEFLPLSYHGMRAKDKTFNASFNMNLDKKIGKINIVPQDMGRVLLNLFNNAFYAVNQRSQLSKGLKPLESLEEYAPSVVVTTFKKEDCIEIYVKDNGGGIPESLKTKIFQPFFTTKPTGEGTGLGLSLSYDIVTKGHGGELEVESTEGVGTEFLIKLFTT